MKKKVGKTRFIYFALSYVNKQNYLSDRIQESRYITQYHYVAWPDHGVPDTTTGLHRLREKMIETQKNNHKSKESPIIVHCR